MQKRNKLIILSNSVGLRIRPRISGGSNYARILEENLGFEVVHFGEGARLVSHFHKNVDIFIRENPSYVLINIGIVDACSREIPYYLYRWMTSKSQSRFSIWRTAFYTQVLKYVRRYLCYLRLNRPWTLPGRFRRELDGLIRQLLRECDCKIVVLGINNPSDRIERQLPYSKYRVKEYNKVIKDIALQDERLKYIDVDNLTPQKYYPDGVHYNQEGHRVIVAEIVKAIESIE